MSDYNEGLKEWFAAGDEVDRLLTRMQISLAVLYATWFVAVVISFSTGTGWAWLLWLAAAGNFVYWAVREHRAQKRWEALL